MSLKPREEDDMTRLRKRAEMQPSDDDDGGSSDHNSFGGSFGSDQEQGTGEGGEDGWSEEEEEQEEQKDGHGKPSEAGKRGITDAAKSDQERSIGERLEGLSHGAGPSRRKRHLKSASGGLALEAKSEAKVTTQGKRRDSGQGNVSASNTSHTSQDQEHFQKGGAPRTHSRANKNRPQEASSLRAVGRFREVVVGKRKTSRDPRFEGGGGSSKLNYDIFRKAYGFLGTYQDSEIEELKKSLKKEKDQERSGRLQALLTRLQQERAERSQGDRRQTALREAKKQERQAVEGGKKPYFLKGSEKKRLSMEQRYEGLREEGKLSKFMENKRKKNAAKDHRWLPAKRQDRG